MGASNLSTNLRADFFESKVNVLCSVFKVDTAAIPEGVLKYLRVFWMKKERRRSKHLWKESPSYLRN